MSDVAEAFAVAARDAVSAGVWLTLCIAIAALYAKYYLVKSPGRSKARRFIQPRLSSADVWSAPFWLCAASLGASLASFLVVPVSLIAEHVTQCSDAAEHAWLSQGLSNGLGTAALWGTAFGAVFAVPFAYFYDEAVGVAWLGAGNGIVRSNRSMHGVASDANRLPGAEDTRRQGGAPSAESETDASEQSDSFQVRGRGGRFGRCVESILELILLLVLVAGILFVLHGLMLPTPAAGAADMNTGDSDHLATFIAFAYTALSSLAASSTLFGLHQGFIELVRRSLALLVWPIRLEGAEKKERLDVLAMELAALEQRIADRHRLLANRKATSMSTLVPRDIIAESSNVERKLVCELGAQYASLRSQTVMWAIRRNLACAALTLMNVALPGYIIVHVLGSELIAISSTLALWLSFAEHAHIPPFGKMRSLEDKACSVSDTVFVMIDVLSVVYISFAAIVGSTERDRAKMAFENGSRETDKDSACLSMSSVRRTSLRGLVTSTGSILCLACAIPVVASLLKLSRVDHVPAFRLKFLKTESFSQGKLSTLYRWVFIAIVSRSYLVFFPFQSWLVIAWKRSEQLLTQFAAVRWLARIVARLRTGLMAVMLLLGKALLHTISTALAVFVQKVWRAFFASGVPVVPARRQTAGQ